MIAYELVGLPYPLGYTVEAGNWIAAGDSRDERM